MDTPISIDPSPEPTPVQTTPATTRLAARTPTSLPPVRAGILLGVALLVAIGSAVAMGASSSPSSASASANPGATSSSPPEKGPKDGHGFGRGGFGAFGGLIPGFANGKAGRGFGQITITSISGSDVSLTTDDGWTRTIQVTATTKVTRGGAAATAADLKVGDAIRFRQTKNGDGTFTITAIDIVLPRILGTITETSASALTITDRDGKTVTVHLGAGTTFRVRGVDNAKASDLGKGMIVLVVGERRGDGSIDATGILAGKLGDHVKGPKPDRPAASAGPEASDEGG